MITVDWGLPDDIDAAFLFYEDTYFFKVTIMEGVNKKLVKSRENFLDNGGFLNLKFWWPLFLALKTRVFLGGKSDIWIPKCKCGKVRGGPPF